MKKLMNLKGVKALNKKQQKEIFGGDDFTHAPPEGGGGGGCWVMCGNGIQVPTGHCSFAGWACIPHGWTICTC